MAGDQRYKIFAGNLPMDCTAEELKIIFGIYGNVVDIHLMNNNKSASGQGCAFVIFDRQDSCENAIAQLDGVCKLREEVELPPMRVAWARSGGAGPPTGGFGGGYGAAKGGKGAWAPWNAGPAPGWGGGLAGGKAFGKGFKGGFAPPAGKGVWNQQRPPAPAHFGPRSKLFVGNLPVDVTPEVLQVVFQNYGTVTNIHVMSGKSKSGQACAFVEYASPAEAEVAVVTLHEKYEIKAGEGPIMVKFASSQSRPAPY